MLTPLTLAVFFGHSEIANVLMRSGARHQPEVSIDTGPTDLTGFAMIFKPQGLAPPVLRSYLNVSARPRWTRSTQSEPIDPQTEKDLLNFISSAEFTDRHLTHDLAERLISANFSLGLQAILDLGLDPNQHSVDGKTSLLTHALRVDSKECAVVLVAYGGQCDLELIFTLVPILLEVINRLETQGFREEAERMADSLVTHFPESHRAAACSFLLGQAIEYSAAKTMKLINDNYNQGTSATWPIAPVDGRGEDLQLTILREHEQYGGPLTFAAYIGRLEVVEMLLESVPESVDTAYDSALSTAIIAGHPRVVEILLDAGVDARRSSPGNESPLICAARCNEVEIASLLIQRGADPHQVSNREGES